jgi:hypothetical protein
MSIVLVQTMYQSALIALLRIDTPLCLYILVY